MHACTFSLDAKYMCNLTQDVFFYFYPFCCLFKPSFDGKSQVWNFLLRRQVWTLIPITNLPFKTGCKEKKKQKKTSLFIFIFVLCASFCVMNFYICCLTKLFSDNKDCYLHFTKDKNQILKIGGTCYRLQLVNAGDMIKNLGKHFKAKLCLYYT